MFNYKTSWCTSKKDSHESMSCNYAHHLRDFRRPPMLFRYSAEDCEVLGNDGWESCPRGLKCFKCHTMVERLYHPEKYKLVPCDKQRCNQREICAFYHNTYERNLALTLRKQYRMMSKKQQRINEGAINELHY